jgi:hypothetical protein
MKRGSGTRHCSRNERTPRPCRARVAGIVNEFGPESVARKPDAVPESQRQLAPRCRNCGASAPGRYCPECGQETRVALPTIRELMRDAAGRLVALDSRLWRTLFLLLCRPGLLTQEYLRGRRRSYVRPARLFFVMSLLMFAAIRLIAPPISFALDSGPNASASTAVEQARSAIAAKNAATDAAGRGGAATIVFDDETELFLNQAASHLPAELRKRIDRFKQLNPVERIEQINAGVARFAPYAMVVLLPVFAWLQLVAYLPGRRRHPQRPRRYAEHLVYGAHLHAFAFLMIIALLLVPRGALQVALGIWIAIYLARACRRVYGDSWLGGFLRMLGVGLVYLVMLQLVMLGLVAIAVALG